MIAISVKQPWASLIVHGIKDIENRTWVCPQKYIGHRVLIHASLKGANFWDSPEAGRVDEFLREISKSGTDWSNYPNGAIIGSVVFTDCVINHQSVWAEKTHMAKLGEHELPSCLYPPYKPIYNWVASDPILFDIPIPAKGKLSFWDFPNIGCEQDEDGKDVCCCHIGIHEKDQVLSYGGGDYRCKYCGGKWYK